MKIRSTKGRIAFKKGEQEIKVERKGILDNIHWPIWENCIFEVNDGSD